MSNFFCILFSCNKTISTTSYLGMGNGCKLCKVRSMPAPDTPTSSHPSRSAVHCRRSTPCTWILHRRQTWMHTAVLEMLSGPAHSEWPSSCRQQQHSAAFDEAPLSSDAVQYAPSGVSPPDCVHAACESWMDVRLEWQPHTGHWPHLASSRHRVVWRYDAPCVEVGVIQERSTFPWRQHAQSGISELCMWHLELRINVLGLERPVLLLRTRMMMAWKRSGAYSVQMPLRASAKYWRWSKRTPSENVTVLLRRNCII